MGDARSSTGGRDREREFDDEDNSDEDSFIENDEEDDDQEEDEEDDDEDDSSRKGGSSSSKKRKKNGVSKYLDIAAEEDDDEEDEISSRKRRKPKSKRKNAMIDDMAIVGDDEDDDYDDEGDLGNFVEHNESNEAEAASRALERQGRQRDLDRRRHLEAEEDIEAEARRLEEKYGGKRYKNDGAFGGYDGEGGFEGPDAVPESFLLPQVDDPNIWCVRCKPGIERETILKIMRRFMERQDTEHPLSFTSISCRDNLKGYLYFEAPSYEDVQQACFHIPHIYLTKYNLIPIKERVDILKVTPRKIELKPGNWVRMLRGKYKGDLAKVLEVPEAGGDYAKVKLIPRLDYSAAASKATGGSGRNGTLDEFGNERSEELDRQRRMDEEEQVGPNGKKIKKKAKPKTQATRPPPKLFTPADVDKADRTLVKLEHYWVWGKDKYVQGFLEKDFRVTTISSDNVEPTLAEITSFASGERGGDGKMSQMATGKKQASSTFSVGELIDIVEGELINTSAIVKSIQGTTVNVVPKDVAGLGSTVIELDASQVRKAISVGMHVYVTSGRYRSESGMVVNSPRGSNSITIYNRETEKELEVFKKDVKEATDIKEVNQQEGSTGNQRDIDHDFEIYDLVQLDARRVGLITSIAVSSLNVIDEDGSVRTVKPQAVQKKYIDPGIQVFDALKNPFGIGETVHVKSGPREGIQGQVKHIDRETIFAYDRTLIETSGIFVCRTDQVLVIGGRGLQDPNDPEYQAAAMTNASKTQSTVAAGTANATSGTAGSLRSRGPRDPLLNKQVKIIGGRYKSYIGTVKDSTADTVRVKLQALGAKLVMVEKQFIRAEGEHMAPAAWSNQDSSRPRWNGGRTPNAAGNGDGGRTPGYGAGGRTPGYGGGKTPGWSGGKTPGYGAQTPNYGGKTPAWDPSSNQSSSNAWQASSATPAYSGLGASNTWGSDRATGQNAGGVNDWGSNSAAARNAGGTTPGWSGSNSSTAAGRNAGGATPGWSGSNSSTAAGRNAGGATPGWSGSNSNSAAGRNAGGATPGWGGGNSSSGAGRNAGGSAGGWGGGNSNVAAGRNAGGATPGWGGGNSSAAAGNNAGSSGAGWGGSSSAAAGRNAGASTPGWGGSNSAAGQNAGASASAWGGGSSNAAAGQNAGGSSSNW